MSKQVRLFIGPQHPGITGNMSLEVMLEGDTIVESTTHVGYLHRAFEKLMEQRIYIQSFPLICRICVPEPDTNEENFARGLEELSGIEIPERAKWIRTLVLELSRLVSLMQWYGGIAGTIGLGTAPQWSVGDRDYVVDLMEELTGARIYHIFITPGGVRRDLPDGFKEHALKVMDYLESRLKDYDDLILENAVFKKRTIGLGKLKKEWVTNMGITGPAARSCGFPLDVRKNAPYEAYDKLDFDVITEDGCDVYAMTKVRRREIQLSINLVRQILDKMPEGEYFRSLGNVFNWKIPRGETYVLSEATRGEFGYYVVTDGSKKPRRIQVRGASTSLAFTLLPELLKGANIADVSPIMVALQICPPEIER